MMMELQARYLHPQRRRQTPYLTVQGTRNREIHTGVETIKP